MDQEETNQNSNSPNLDYNFNDENLISIGIGKYEVKKEGFRLMTMGIGSCVATVIYDSISKIYGMAHIMLPCRGDLTKKTSNPNKYADICIKNMLADMEKMGAKRGNMKAKIAGGAHMFPSLEEHPTSINKKNIESVKRVLQEEGVKLIAEDIGGNNGRTIIFNTDTEEFRLLIRSQHIEKIL